jgi:spore photoproduct lyase
MIDLVYIEESIREHPGTIEILSRFPKATLLSCTHYKEIFNPSGQNFRLQKRKPALILAKQTGKFIHPIPPSYGVGGNHNYYFSHLLNCLYDCRYCFLQGMYPSSHFVHFINAEDFQSAISKASHETEEESWFFSGYDCDSLALESITRFAHGMIPFFRELPNAWLELRTKSTNLKVLENHSPLKNAVVAFSFTPEEISKQTEWKVPPLNARIQAMKKVAAMGWKVGWRIDPVIDCQNFELRYAKLFDSLLSKLPMKKLHSVSLGAFRMPSGFFKKMQKTYPTEPLFAGELEKRSGMFAYKQDLEQKRLKTCEKLLLERIPQEKLFSCKSPIVNPK